MKAQVLLAVVVAGVAYAQDAPGDVAPGDVQAPFDPIEEGQVQWCLVNEDCSLFGDVAAKCTNGVCECTEPQYKYLSTAWGCFPREFNNVGEVLQRFLITIALTFTDVDCQKFFALNPTGPRDLLSLLQTYVGFAISHDIITCGSVNVGFEFEGTAADVERFSTIEQDLPVELAKVDSLTSLAASPVVASISTAQSGACPMDNANRTVVIENRCHALTCNPGYNVSTSSAGIHLCLPSTIPSSSDDDLTDAEIAGIVLGSVTIAACIIGLLVVFGLGRRTGEEDPANKNVPVQQNTELTVPKEPEVPESPNAPFGCDDHAQPNDPSGATTDGTEGTIVV